MNLFKYIFIKTCILPNCNHGHNILSLFVKCSFHHKPRVIVTNKHGIYKLPHQLANDLRFRTLGDQEISVNLNITVYCRVTLKILSKLPRTKKLPQKRTDHSPPCGSPPHMKTRARLRYPAHDCLCRQFFVSNSFKAPSNLIYLTILVTLRPLTQF